MKRSGSASPEKETYYHCKFCKLLLPTKDEALEHAVKSHRVDRNQILHMKEQLLWTEVGSNEIDFPVKQNLQKRIKFPQSEDHGHEHEVFIPIATPDVNFDFEDVEFDVPQLEVQQDPLQVSENSNHDLSEELKYQPATLTSAAAPIPVYQPPQQKYCVKCSLCLRTFAEPISFVHHTEVPKWMECYHHLNMTGTFIDSSNWEDYAKKHGPPECVHLVIADDPLSLNNADNQNGVELKYKKQSTAVEIEVQPLPTPVTTTNRIPQIIYRVKCSLCEKLFSRPEYVEKHATSKNWMACYHYKRKAEKTNFPLETWLDYVREQGQPSCVLLRAPFYSDDPLHVPDNENGAVQSKYVEIKTISPPPLPPPKQKQAAAAPIPSKDVEPNYRFKCSLCEKRFTSSTDLVKHLGSPSWKACADQLQLTNHLLSLYHQSGVSGWLDYVRKRGPPKSIPIVQADKVRGTGEWELECLKCSKIFNTGKELMLHNFQDHKDTLSEANRNFRCSLCAKSFHQPEFASAHFERKNWWLGCRSELARQGKGDVSYFKDLLETCGGKPKLLEPYEKFLPCIRNINVPECATFQKTLKSETEMKLFAGKSLNCSHCGLHFRISEKFVNTGGRNPR